MLSEIQVQEIIDEEAADYVQEMTTGQVKDVISRVLSGSSPNEVASRYAPSSSATAQNSWVVAAQDLATLAIAVKTTWEVMKALSHDEDALIIIANVEALLDDLVSKKLKPVVLKVIKATIETFKKGGQ